MSKTINSKSYSGAPEVEVEADGAFSQAEHAYNLDEKAHVADYKADAVEAENAEHNMGVVEAIRAYPMASFWAFVMSFTIVSYLFPSSLDLSSYYESHPITSPDYGVLRCLPHRQFYRPTRVRTKIRCRVKRQMVHCAQVAVCASSVWSARCAYRRLPRWSTHQPYRIPLRDLNRPHALECLHLRVLLCQFASSHFRCPASRGFAMGYLHCQRAGILQRDCTDKAARPCYPDAADVLGDWQYHRWCRHLPLQQ